jgi:hypothetical protein
MLPFHWCFVADHTDLILFYNDHATREA